MAIRAWIVLAVLAWPIGGLFAQDVGANGNAPSSAGSGGAASPGVASGGASATGMAPAALSGSSAAPPSGATAPASLPSGAGGSATHAVGAPASAAAMGGSASVSPGLATSPQAASQSSAGGTANLPRTTGPGQCLFARVSAGSGTLPNTHGQIWREYDISQYTQQVSNTRQPEQAIVDWILRETGYEVWHSEPLGILSATPQVLRVYHTPQVQALVADVVDRFLNPDAQGHGFSLRIITLDSPNWRVRAQRLLQPVPAQTPGVQAWLLEKEGAALLLADLRRRTDYREHNSPHLLVPSGQSAVVSAFRGRNYVRNITFRPEVWPGYEPETALVDEGFSLEFSPLLSVDGRMVDAILRCHIDQVEKFEPVMLDVPTPAAPRQRTKIEVPQWCQIRFHERFRWPVQQVLLVGLGVVPSPVPGEPRTMISGLALPFGSGAPRADLLILVESKGKSLPVRASTAGQGGVGPYSLR